MLGVAETATGRRSPRRTASWPASSHPDANPATPRPRSASRRSRRPTTCSATTTSARSTTRSASSGPIGGGFQGGGSGRRAAAASTSTSAADGLGDLLGSLFGRGRRGGGRVGGGRPAARRRPRGRAAPRLRRRGAAAHHHAAPHQRRAVLARATAPAPSPARSRRSARNCGGRGVDRRQPGLLLVLVAVPRAAAARRDRSTTVPDLPRHRRRAPAARGEGAHPGRRRRRAAHPAQGPRCAGSQRRPAGRPLVECHVTPHRLFGRDGNNLTVTRAGHLRRGRARRRRRGADARRAAGHAALKPGTQSGTRHRVKGKGIVDQEGAPAT